VGSIARIFANGMKSMSRSLPMGTAVANSSTNDGRGWMFGGLLPGAQIDYQLKAGQPWKNSVIAASLGWIARNAPQAPPCVYRMTDDGEEAIVPRHPLTQVLKRPNKFYDGRTLRQATFLSLVAGHGEAYWWVKRDNAGRALEFWWLPHWNVWPIWEADSTTDNWITGYGYRNNGVTYVLPEDEVIHFRDGIDPERPRNGLDQMRPASREIVTDNEAAAYAAQLLSNMCIPGVIIYPKGEARFEQPDADEFKNRFREESGGDNRFQPVVMSSEIGVEKLSFTPENMALHTMQDRPEARLCAMTGINPIVLGLTVGLEHSKYSNMKEARAGAWEDGIIPRLELIHSELDTQVLAHYPDSDDLRVGADYRRVQALRDMMNEQMARLSLAVGGPYVSPNEARAQLGLPNVAGLDKPYPAKNAPQFGDPGTEGGATGTAGTTKEIVSGERARRLIAAGWNGNGLHG